MKLRIYVNTVKTPKRNLLQQEISISRRIGRVSDATAPR